LEERDVASHIVTNLITADSTMSCPRNTLDVCKHFLGDTPEVRARGSFVEACQCAIGASFLAVLQHAPSIGASCHHFGTDDRTPDRNVTDTVLSTCVDVTSRQ